MDTRTEFRVMGPARWAAVALGALVLTGVVTWPLARCLDSCHGPPPDPLSSIYYLRWVVHAFTTPGVRLLDASIYAPYAGTLALGEYVPLYALLALPAILTTGNPVLGHNVVVVSQYTLAALGTAALALRLVGAPGPALLAGIVFAYSPHLLQKTHNIQMLSAFWFPWLFLALERFLARPTWLAAAAVTGVGLALALSSMVDLMFASVAAALFIGFARVWGGRRFGPAHLLRLAGMGAAAAGLLAAYLAPYWTLSHEWRLRRALVELEEGSVGWRDYLSVPPEQLLHRLTGVGLEVGIFRQPLFPGLTVAALAVAGLVAVVRGRQGLRSPLGPYVLLAGAAAALAFGPTWHSPWGALPLPYRALYLTLPGFHAIRTPARFAGFLALALALLAGAGAARLVGRLGGSPRRMVLGALAILVLVEGFMLPFPGTEYRLTPAALPEVYRWLGTQDARTVAMELPMGRRDWISLAGAVFHLRRTVNGASSYRPPLYDDLVAAMAAFPDPRTVALIQGIHPDVVLVDSRGIDSGRLAALESADAGLRLERSVGPHLVYRLAGGTPPGVETLEATLALHPTVAGQPPGPCVTLRNPGAGYVPLYPLRRMRLTVETGGRPVSTSVHWLPLDLAPGVAHVACAGLSEPAAPAALRVRGEIEGAGRVHRFAATPGNPPQRPMPAPAG